MVITVFEMDMAAESCDCVCFVLSLPPSCSQCLVPVTSRPKLINMSVSGEPRVQCFPEHRVEEGPYLSVLGEGPCSVWEGLNAVHL